MLTLALCIGANTAIYSVVDRVLLRPLPYPQPERLAQVITRFERGGGDQIGQTGGTWEALRAGVTSLDLATTSGGFGTIGVNLVVGQHAEYVAQQRVSAGFFHVLGVAPARGREFTADEDRPNGPAAAVLSHRLWLRLFNGDAAAIGRSITLRGEPHTIVGIMPAGFTSDAPADVWTPVRPSKNGEGGGQNYAILARLKPGATWAQADADVASAGQPVMADLYRSTPNAARLGIIPLQQGETTQVQQPILILWAAVAVVLLIGCVNIAGLLMARGVARAPEIATRMALGGGRAAIVRQLLTESAVLAVAGGIAGVALGYAGARLFASLLQDAFGVAPDAVGLDGRVLAVDGGDRARHEPAVRSVSGAAGLARRSARHAGRIRQPVDRRRRARLAAAPAGRHRGRARPRPARRRGAADSHGQRPDRPARRLRRHQVMTATLSLQDARYQTAERVNRFFDDSLARMRADCRASKTPRPR